jgi:hypothetical protein
LWEKVEEESLEELEDPLVSVKLKKYDIVR